MAGNQTLSAQETFDFESTFNKATNPENPDTARASDFIKLGRHEVKNDIFQGREYYRKALELADANLEKEEGDSNWLEIRADAYIGIGIAERRLGNYSLALDHYQEARLIFEQLNNQEGLGTIFFNMGAIYKKMKQNDRAIEYYEKSLKIREEGDDIVSIINCYNALGIMRRKAGEFDKALEFYRKTVRMSREENRDIAEAQAYSNIGVVYQKQDLPDSALFYMRKALGMHFQAGREVDVANSKLLISGIFKDTDNGDSTIYYATEALETFERKGILPKIARTHLRLSTAYRKTGDFEQAYNSLRAHHKVQDSLFNEEKTREFAQQEMQYDFDKQQLELEAEQEQARIQKRLNWFLGGGLGLLVLLSLALLRFNRIVAREKKRSEELLLNILPSETAEELKATGESKPKPYDVVTVLFTDFKGFTFVAEQLTPGELVAEIDYCFKAFDEIIGQYRIEKIKTIGDAYMCAGGLPGKYQENAAETIRAALEIRDFMLRYKKEREAAGRVAFEIRIGLHSGPVVAGVVGLKKFAYDIWGDTVNLAARMESSGEPGKVNVSGASYELAKTQFDFEYRGKVKAKNKGEVDMYFVEWKKV